jgi:hypothetical protein
MEVLKRADIASARQKPLTMEAVFHAALAIEAADQRSAYLDAACAEQPKLRRRVEALLRRYAESQGPLDRPVHDP